MRITGFLFLLFCASVLHAQMYKWVDENGKTHFSDTPPPEGAETYEPPPIPTVKATEPLKLKATENNNKSAGKYYKSLVVVSPKQDETLFPDTPNVVISILPTPELNTAESHELVITLNGKVVQKGTATSYTMQNPDRGAYSVSATIRDARGKTQISSDTVTFNVKRHHL
jgi:hypothetical protein